MIDQLAPDTNLPPAIALRRLIFGHRVTTMIAIATQLGLADLLGDGAYTADELARQVGVQPRALERLLRALSSIGIIAAHSEGRYGLTPIGQCLRHDAPDSQRSWVLLESADFFQHAWSHLGNAIETGIPAAEHALGMPFYRYMAGHAHVGALFQRAMSEASQLAADAVVAAYPFAPHTRVVDVGGGYGTLLIAILRAHPTVRGVLFDRPEVIDAARERLAAAGVLDRCELVGGDFFAAIPGGGDVYILSRILMDHNDAHSLQILRQCHAAMAENGQLLVIQQVLPDDASDSTLYDGALSDMNMLVFLPGGERTLAEYRALLREAGFALTSIVATRALMSIVEGTRTVTERAVGAAPVNGNRGR
ncbi:MAG TPA: methyltransferase [Roseiflexaceae bacterium]|nr:methyltransferase [Roseiflexaceae bacterium]